MRFSVAVLAAACSLTAAPLVASTLTLQETLGTFNLVTESYSGTQEVEGRTFIGSDLSNVTGQFGFVDPGDGLGYSALNVDGSIVNSIVNLTPTTEARISGTSVGSFVNNGTLTENATDLPEFDFSSFAAESAYLASLTGTAANVSDYNQKVFGGNAVVDVDISDLAGGGYTFDLAGFDTVIINVSGTTGSFAMNAVGGVQPSDATNVLWNFYEATDVFVNTKIVGHVLAPLATMTGFAGSSEGTVIARQVALTNGELHQQAWGGTVPMVAAVPLPAGLPLMLAGLFGLAAAGRRARRQS